MKSFLVWFIYKYNLCVQKVNIYITIYNIVERFTTCFLFLFNFGFRFPHSISYGERSASFAGGLKCMYMRIKLCECEKSEKQPTAG